MSDVYVLYQDANYLGSVEVVLELYKTGELSLVQSDSGLSTQEAFGVPYHRAQIDVSSDAVDKLLLSLKSDSEGLLAILRRKLGHICALESFSDLLDEFNVPYVFSSQYASNLVQAY